MRDTTNDFLQSVQDQIFSGTSVEVDVMVKANFLMLSELMKQFKQQQQELIKLQRQVERLQGSSIDDDEAIAEFKEEAEDQLTPNFKEFEKPVSPVEFGNLEDKSATFWSRTSNPDSLSQYLDTAKGMDPELTLTTTQRGEDLLIYQGFSYRKKVHGHTVLEDGRGIVKWRCSKQHKKDNCRGQVATTLDGLCVLRDSVTKHNHRSDQSGINGVLLRERIREIVTNHPTMKTMDILASAELLLPPSSTSSNRLRDDRSLHRFIQRIKAKQSSVS